MNEKLEISIIILSIFGVAGNIISIVVCLRKKLRIIPTFVFMAFLSVLNICKLITIVFCLFASNFFVTKLQEFDSRFFKIMIFLIFWEYQSSAYFKVFLMIFIKFWIKFF
jgi:hypothetical protein